MKIQINQKTKKLKKEKENQEDNDDDDQEDEINKKKKQKLSNSKIQDNKDDKDYCISLVIRFGLVKKTMVFGTMVFLTKKPWFLLNKNFFERDANSNH